MKVSSETGSGASGTTRGSAMRSAVRSASSPRAYSPTASTNNGSQAISTTANNRPANPTRFETGRASSVSAICAASSLARASEATNTRPTRSAHSISKPNPGKAKRGAMPLLKAWLTLNPAYTKPPPAKTTITNSQVRTMRRTERSSAAQTPKKASIANALRGESLPFVIRSWPSAGGTRPTVVHPASRCWCGGYRPVCPSASQRRCGIVAPGCDALALRLSATRLAGWG